MFVRLTCAFAAAVLIALPGYAATPAPKATLSPMPQGTEVAFVASISKDLMARFPTPADAIRSGYFRYGNEDEDGAISYANLQWQSGSPKQPSQLWYDVHGNLLGADFSVLQSSSPEPPAIWGVSYRRWVSFRAHVHYILNGPNGMETYGATSVKKFVAAGGNIDNPQAATIVKMGVVKNVADVKRVFLFPSIWDLIVWVKPNPLGAFAEKNPNVIPSANAGKDDM
ncbi:MAG: hypothetical protein JO190_12145 [Candidatus Eremiobacteraeota bacterium]|nr:hypothetical protein [Candidatus Eremiobacteraeota bacterium]MBV8497756.1 hypothetical protein [Candidatus Eremiobacteraeota bacterium]